MMANRVKFATWNVNGTNSIMKHQDDGLVELVNSLDFVALTKDTRTGSSILALTETWTDKSFAMNVSGYGSIHKNREKRCKKRRPNGGLTFMYKLKYKNNIHKFPCSHEDMLIIQIKGEAIGHTKDIFIFVVYVRYGVPSSSHTVLDDLESSMSELCHIGDSIIMGDFNARTGDLEDIDINSKKIWTENVPFSDTDHLEHIATRQNCDKIINNYGKEVIDLCKSTDHIILNGRFLGDYMGYFTYISEQGSSLID